MRDVIRRRASIVVRKLKTRGVPAGAPEQYIDTTCEVEIEIDINALFASLGPKACRARGRKSVLGGGMVIARRLK